MYTVWAIYQNLEQMYIAANWLLAFIFKPLNKLMIEADWLPRTAALALVNVTNVCGKNAFLHLVLLYSQVNGSGSAVMQDAPSITLIDDSVHSSRPCWTNRPTEWG